LAHKMLSFIFEVLPLEGGRLLLDLSPKIMDFLDHERLPSTFFMKAKEDIPILQFGPVGNKLFGV
jgi:hypothetical protein